MASMPTTEMFTWNGIDLSFRGGYEVEVYRKQSTSRVQRDQNAKGVRDPMFLLHGVLNEWEHGAS